MTTMAGIIVKRPIASGGQLVPVPWSPITSRGAQEHAMLAKYTGVVAAVLDNRLDDVLGVDQARRCEAVALFSAWTLAVAPPQPNVAPCKLMDTAR